MNSKKYIQIVFIIILFPILTAIITSLKSPFEITISNDWIGFYASYIGSIIGVVGVYLVMRLDQKERNRERDDERFFTNIDTYRRLAQILKQRDLYIMEKDLRVMLESENWENIDIKTSNEVKKIKSEMYYCDEHRGFSNSLIDYIYSNLKDVLKVNLRHYDEAADEVVWYEDLPTEILDKFTNAVINNYNVDFYENKFELELSKNDLINKFENESELSHCNENIDIIFDKLSNFESSNELKNYLMRRDKIYSRIANISKLIDKRIERVLSY